MKTWTCTQCGDSVSKDLLNSFRSTPSECATCGNDEFEEVVLGKLHRIIDG